jgi:predicted metalloprotease with PDZ domain
LVKASFFAAARLPPGPMILRRPFFETFRADAPGRLRVSSRHAALCALVLAGIFFPASLRGGEAPIRYTLDLREPASHVVRVTMEIPGAAAGTRLQFPAWNALYQIRDFVRHVQDVEAQCNGQVQPLTRLDVNTWKSGPENCATLAIRYSVYANEEGVYSAVLSREHAFMNLAGILFYVPEQRARPVQARFILPENWKLATLLEEEGAAGEFAAANYDALVDSPAEAGAFRLFEYQQNGATYRVVVDADPEDYSSKRLLESLKKITLAATTMMGEAPFKRYTFILHFPRGGGGGGMEHANGTAISYPADDLKSNWGGLEATLAHEFSHAWNVKRIRPQNLEPVDYVHGNDTRDLWFCEGVDSTYAELFLLRAGLIDGRTFFFRLAGRIAELQERPARLSQSVKQAGMEAWLEKYPDYLRPVRSISYYTKGEILGYLLDLAIRHATECRRSLDDVMRRLNTDFAQRGRLFTEADLRAIIRELAPEFGNLDSFFSDYVSGTREIDYNTYFGYAGLRLRVTADKGSSPGFSVGRLFDERVVVEDVAPDSPAAAAGLEAGDILVRLNGKKPGQSPQSQVDRLRRGETLRLCVLRGHQELQLSFVVGTSRRFVYGIEEVNHVTEEQRRLREAWLNGTTLEAVGAGKP